MKYLIRTSVVLFFMLPMIASANLEVAFEATPLFSEASLLPGDAVQRTITVSNTGTETESVEFTFENILSSDLAAVTELAVRDVDTVYVYDTFANLFASGPQALGVLPADTVRTYTFSAALPPTASNPLQNDWFGFDIRIGFVGEEQITDRNTGGGGSTQTLQLFNEIAVEDDDISGAFLAWNSNRTASTYLVCGDIANGPFVLSETGPLFGYEFALAEEDLATTEHGVAVSDLAPGEYECRPAGREDTDDGFTVGDPVQFTVALAGQVAGESISLSEADIQELLQGVIDTQLGSSVIGTNSKGAGGMTYEEFRADIDARANTAAATSTEPEIVAVSEETRTEPQNTADTPETVEESEPTDENRTIWLFGAIIALLLAIWWVFARRFN